MKHSEKGLERRGCVEVAQAKRTVLEVHLTLPSLDAVDAFPDHVFEFVIIQAKDDGRSASEPDRIGRFIVDNLGWIVGAHKCLLRNDKYEVGLWDDVFRC